MQRQKTIRNASKQKILSFIPIKLKNFSLEEKNVCVEKLCPVCECHQTWHRTFLLPPALEWATIPRCHSPAVRGPAIPKRTRRFAGAKYGHHRGQESEDLRKMNPSLLSTAYSHLWK